MNADLLAAVKNLAKRRLREKLSRKDALLILVKEGINNEHGGLTKEYGGTAEGEHEQTIRNTIR